MIVCYSNILTDIKNGLLLSFLYILVVSQLLEMYNNNLLVVSICSSSRDNMEYNLYTKSSSKLDKRMVIYLFKFMPA